MDDDPKSVGPRSAAKRDRIVDAALRHFAEHGYQGARMGDVAAELGIAKGSVFQHFGSKAGLFLATYKRAVSSLRTGSRIGWPSSGTTAPTSS